MFEELRQSVGRRGEGGFLPAVKQIANVVRAAPSTPRHTPRHADWATTAQASLPGIVGASIGLPDVHSGCVSEPCAPAARPECLTSVEHAGTASQSATSRPSTWPTRMRSCRRAAWASTSTAACVFCARIFTTTCARALASALDSARQMAGCPQDVKPVQERLTQSLFDHIPVSARPLALQGVRAR